MIAAVGAGGLVGTTARWFLVESWPVAPGSWPVTTFAINMAGALLLGFVLEALTRVGPDTSWRRTLRLGVGTGALGSFTTYSTFAVEIEQRLRGGEEAMALSYAVGTVVAGVVLTGAGVVLGAWLGSWWRQR